MNQVLTQSKENNVGSDLTVADCVAVNTCLNSDFIHI